MIKLLKKSTAPKFEVGDRVTFLVISVHDNYSPTYKPAYGYIYKLNKKTMVILGVDGEKYKADISEVKPYVDPFQMV